MKGFIHKKIKEELLLEKIVGTTIVCDRCGWDWEIEDGGNDLYICHKCDNDNTPKGVKKLSENVQLADKVYFNTGKLSPRVKEIIISKITGGDHYTKLITDIYYAELQQSLKMGDWAIHGLDGRSGEYVEKDVYTTDDDILRIETWKEIKSHYQQLKVYNKNLFPIKDLNINGVEDIWGLITALKQRAIILDKIKVLPSIAMRNMRDDIRTPRNGQEMNHYRDRLEYFLGYYSQLDNRDDDAKGNVYKKMFKSGVTMEDLVNFAEDKGGLLGGNKFTPSSVKKLVANEETGELQVIYEKDKIMVVKVEGPYGIKAIGCNSLWCFTYGEGWSRDWSSYSTNDVVYAIIDFSEDSDSADFMHVVIKPIIYNSDDEEVNDESVFDMSNRNVNGPMSFLDYTIGIETAKQLLDFDIEPEEEEEPEEKEFVDPNQLSLFECVKNTTRIKLLENYFTPKISDDIKRLSAKYIGRNVVWYGNPEQMIVLHKDEIHGMWGNIYDSDKMESLVDMIQDEDGPIIELECSYGTGSVISFIDIQEEQESYYTENFMTDYDGQDEPSSTGSDELDHYVGVDEVDELEFIANQVSKQEIMSFFSKFRFSLVRETSKPNDLLSIFKSLNPDEFEVDAFNEFLDLEVALKEAKDNEDGDFNKFSVQLRDGHHRVMGAIKAGEEYVCLNLLKEDIETFKGYYNKVV